MQALLLQDLPRSRKVLRSKSAYKVGRRLVAMFCAFEVLAAVCLFIPAFAIFNADISGMNTSDWIGHIPPVLMAWIVGLLFSSAITWELGQALFDIADAALSKASSQEATEP